MRLYYTDIELPTGRALAAATDAGLARLELRPGSRKAWLDGLRETYGVNASRDDAGFRQLKSELAAYFAGGLTSFTVPIDARGTDFQRRVWAALLKLPYGRVVTYGGLARSIGSPEAARAVGGAVGANPVPILIPCHRVVAVNGGIGGYSCGVDVKKALLEIEGVRAPYRPQ